MRVDVAFLHLGDILSRLLPRLTDPLGEIGIGIVELDDLRQLPSVNVSAVVHDSITGLRIELLGLRVFHTSPNQVEASKYQVSSVNLVPRIDMFVSDDNEVRNAVMVFALLISLNAQLTQSTEITVEERRHLEVVTRAIDDLLESSTFGEEVELIVAAAVSTIHAQLRSPRPDRSIIGRSLGTAAAFIGGAVTGVAANYLTSLLHVFT